MRCVRVTADVRARLKAVPKLVDLPVKDRVVRGWVAQNRVEQGDHINAVDVQVHGMNYARPVWVVVTDSGLVRCVTDPPVRPTFTLWPALIDFVTEATEREG